MIFTETEVASGRPSNSGSVKVVEPAKLAVTVLSLSMVTEQAPDPVQAPLQLLKAYEELAVAVTLTTCPLVYVWPPAAGLIVPPALGLTAVVRVCVPTDVKLAVTVLSESRVTEQAPEPVQAPLQLEKAYPVLGVAVTFTIVP